jgi:hypothetical protein
MTPAAAIGHRPLRAQARSSTIKSSVKRGPAMPGRQRRPMPQMPTRDQLRREFDAASITVVKPRSARQSQAKALLEVLSRPGLPATITTKWVGQQMPTPWRREACDASGGRTAGHREPRVGVHAGEGSRRWCLQGGFTRSAAPLLSEQDENGSLALSVTPYSSPNAPDALKKSS